MLNVAPGTARCNHCSAPPGTRRARLWFCAALHAMLCAARGEWIQRRWSALPARATESTRCTRGCRSVLHAACLAARPLLQRPCDRQETRARAAEERGWVLHRTRCLGSATVACRGEPAAMALERALQGRWGSDPPGTSKRRPRPWCSTPPAKCQGPPAGLECRRKWGAPGRWQGQGPARQGACWKAPCRLGPSSAMAGPGSAGPGGCLGRR